MTFHVNAVMDFADTKQGLHTPTSGSTAIPCISNAPPLNSWQILEGNLYGIMLWIWCDDIIILNHGSKSIVDIKIHQYHQFKPKYILWSLTKAMIFAYFYHGSKRSHPTKNYNLFNYVLLVGCVIDVLFGMMFNLHNIFIKKLLQCCFCYNPQNFLETNTIRAPSILHKLPQIATKFPQTVRYFRELIFFNEAHWVFILVSINF